MQSLESALFQDNSTIERLNEFKDDFESLGVLKKSDAGVRQEDLTAYTAFGNYRLIFFAHGQREYNRKLFCCTLNLKTPKEE